LKTVQVACSVTGPVQVKIDSSTNPSYLNIYPFNYRYTFSNSACTLLPTANLQTRRFLLTILFSLYRQSWSLKSRNSRKWWKLDYSQ
jgi:hypothetical protein